MIATVINGYRHEGWWNKPLFKANPLDKLTQLGLFLPLLSLWNLHLLTLTELLTRHKNFADSVKLTVLIDLSAHDSTSFQPLLSTNFGFKLVIACKGGATTDLTSR